MNHAKSLPESRSGGETVEDCFMLNSADLQSIIRKSVDDVLQHLSFDNLTASRTDMSEGETDMGKSKRIKRAVIINGVRRWICGTSEQEYADHIIQAYLGSQPDRQTEQPGQSPAAGHDFKTYAGHWFEVFSKPNIAQVTAATYERNLRLHIYPAFKGKNIEEIDAADVQNMFNNMSGAKQTKAKAWVILNMIFQQAIEDGLLTKNPLHSRSIRITGSASKPTKPYSVEQMRFLVQRIGKLSHPMDRAYLALQALHPLRLEEVLGLKGEDVNKAQRLLHIRRAVTHPDRNLPQIKETKTLASNRTLDLVGQVVAYLPDTPADQFILGGKDPLSYTQVRRMCERIRKETGFDEPISPIRFRTTVLTDLYDTTKDIKQAQAAAGHTTAAMTLKHYVKGRHERQNTAAPIASVYGLAADTSADTPAPPKTYTA